MNANWTITYTIICSKEAHFVRVSTTFLLTYLTYSVFVFIRAMYIYKYLFHRLVISGACKCLRIGRVSLISIIAKHDPSINFHGLTKEHYEETRNKRSDH